MCQWKNFENRSTSGEVVDNIIVDVLAHTVEFRPRWFFFKWRGFSATAAPLTSATNGIFSSYREFRSFIDVRVIAGGDFDILGPIIAIENLRSHVDCPFSTNQATNKQNLELCLLWSSCVAHADIIFSSCGFFFFSSPNLSGSRVDVYHTSTHGAASVRI